jgi:hypothetical protein
MKICYSSLKILLLEHVKISMLNKYLREKNTVKYGGCPPIASDFDNL